MVVGDDGHLQSLFGHPLRVLLLPFPRSDDKVQTRSCRGVPSFANPQHTASSSPAKGPGNTGIQTLGRWVRKPHPCRPKTKFLQARVKQSRSTTRSVDQADECTRMFSCSILEEASSATGRENRGGSVSKGQRKNRAVPQHDETCRAR